MQRFAYDPYGTATVLTGGWATTTDAYAWKYRFQGLAYDGYSGLYNGRNRMYSPTLGRWMQADPAGYVDGENLYQFTEGNPVYSVDPFGLTSEIDISRDMSLAEANANAEKGSDKAAQGVTTTLPGKGSITVTITCKKNGDGKWVVDDVKDKYLIKVRVVSIDAIKEYYRTKEKNPIDVTDAEAKSIQDGIIEYEKEYNAKPAKVSWDGLARATKAELKELEDDTKGGLSKKILDTVNKEWLKPHADTIANILDRDKVRNHQEGNVDRKDVLMKVKERVDITIEEKNGAATKPSST